MQRLTDKRRLPALTALWHTCFGDDVREIEAFWARLFDRIDVYAAFSGDAAETMVCALPTELVDEAGEGCPCAYLYALCTAPACRNRGLAAELLTFAADDLRKRGVAFAALAPAEPSLYAYYARQGFQTVGFCDEKTVESAARPIQVRPADPATYRNLREMQLYGAFLSYDAALLALEGRRLLRVETADAVYCADAEKQGDCLLLRELLPADPTVAAALAAHFGCRSAKLRTAGNTIPTAMLRPLGEETLPKKLYFPFDFG